MNRIPKRNEVPIEETWNTGDLFADEDAFEAMFSKTDKDIAQFVEEYKGKMQSAETVIQALNDYNAIYEQIGRLSAYRSLNLEVDFTNSDLSKKAMTFSGILSDWFAQLSFFEPELTESDETLLQEVARDKEHTERIRRILRDKAHYLSPETEHCFAALTPVHRAPYNIYQAIKFRDLHFPDFEAEGKTYPLSYTAFENSYEGHPDPLIRHAAFKAFHRALDSTKHATAAAYNTEVQRDVALAKLRGYDSVFSYLLSSQDVTRTMYDRQIDTIMKELSPIMQKYALFLQKLHGLSEMTTADLKIEPDPTFAPDVTFSEAKALILEGLDVLGEEYGRMLVRAFDERWIDYAENEGKSTGGFCSSPYGVHSYILLSFNRKMNEVMTLAHELGHAGADYYASRNQNIFDTDLSMYFVEAPSTANEIIMEYALLEKAGDDHRRKRWILSQMISKTYYHNFVTHLLEAAFQREVYRRAEQGTFFGAEELSEIYHGVLQNFWGDAVRILPGSELTWMRQPHYYMGLYSYTYSAGLTVGTQVAEQIVSDPKRADRWIDVLKQGGTKSPVALAKMMDIDLTSDGPLKDTIAAIGKLVDSCIALTEKMPRNS